MLHGSRLVMVKNWKSHPQRLEGRQAGAVDTSQDCQVREACSSAYQQMNIIVPPPRGL